MKEKTKKIFLIASLFSLCLISCGDEFENDSTLHQSATPQNYLENSDTISESSQTLDSDENINNTDEEETIHEHNPQKNSSSLQTDEAHNHDPQSDNKAHPPHPSKNHKKLTVKGWWFIPAHVLALIGTKYILEKTVDERIKENLEKKHIDRNIEKLESHSPSKYGSKEAAAPSKTPKPHTASSPDRVSAPLTIREESGLVKEQEKETPALYEKWMNQIVRWIDTALNGILYHMKTHIKNHSSPTSHFALAPSREENDQIDSAAVQIVEVVSDNIASSSNVPPAQRSIFEKIKRFCMKRMENDLNLIRNHMRETIKKGKQ